MTLTLTNQVLKPGAGMVSSGNGNHAIEVNECNLLSLVVSNLGANAMTGASATLRSLTPGLAVVQPFSGYPDIPAGQRGTNLTPFQVTTLPGFVCGANVNLELSVASATHGTLKVPFTLGSGVPGSPARFDVNTPTNIPDVGTIESTNVVAAFSGPLLKVAVSLWLTHTWDADLNLSLISPAGVVVDLSSGNGNGGNFGSGCSPDANRTTFDDDAPTAITAGVPPYIGSFRPEGSLASLIGGAANGNWRLRVQDTTGGTLGAVRCWSLFLYGVDCTPAGGPCELCPEVTIFSATGPTSFTQNGFVDFNGIASTCAAPKACPGTPFPGNGPFPSDNYVFRNGPSAACVTVTLENPNSTQMLVTAYTNSFNPADTNKCLSYLADGGTIVGAGYPTTNSFSFSLAPAAVFVVNVIADNRYSLSPYKLTVSGGNCRPVLTMTPTGPAEAKFDWSTAAAGYHLEYRWSPGSPGRLADRQPGTYCRLGSVHRHQRPPAHQLLLPPPHAAVVTSFNGSLSRRAAATNAAVAAFGRKPPSEETGRNLGALTCAAPSDNWPREKQITLYVYIYQSDAADMRPNHIRRVRCHFIKETGLLVTGHDQRPEGVRPEWRLVKS